jgi:cytochrome b561
MNLKNSADRWGPVSQLLHWVIVLLLLVVATIGLLLESVPTSPKYFWVFDLHKSIGLTVLALAVLRIVWRLVAGAPASLPGTPAWQARLASLTHWLLYAMILAVPLSGWLYDSASGLRPLRWFGLFDVPRLSRPDEGLRELGHESHELLFWVLVALVILHVAAAFYHHLFRHDATLQRMLPRRRHAPPPETRDAP